MTKTRFDGTDNTEAAKAGQFVAEFPDSKRAAAFFERLTGDPDGFYAKDIQRNRANGVLVSWEVDLSVREPALTARGVDPVPPFGWHDYWVSMCETVGYYGSSFGEPPWGSGAKTAYLNGRACPASM